MKRKSVLAMLVMCMTLAVTACGEEKKEESVKQEAAAAQEEETEKESAEEEPAEEETADGENTEEVTEESTEDEKPAEEEKEDTSAPARLVSVDDVTEYVNIGEYKGLTLDNTVEEVTDEDVQYELENTKQEISNGVVENGDQVFINFVGTKDGVAFEGGTAENYELVIGDGLMMDGFEEGIVGMSSGETKDLNLTFPENYGVQDLNGQDVVFEITVLKIMRTPELTDEWIAANTDVKTVDEYREQVRTKLEENAAYYALDTLRSNAWTAVLEASEVTEYPEKDIEEAAAEYRNMYTSFLDQAGISLEEFVESQGFTMDEFEDECQMYAEAKVKQNLIVQGIMDAEGLSIEGPKYLEYQEKMIRDYGAADLANLIDMYGQVAVDESIALLTVEDFIIENATVNELVGSGDQVAENASVEGEIETEIEGEEITEEIPETTGETDTMDEVTEE